MLQDLRSRIRIDSDKQKLADLRATHSHRLLPQQAAQYDSIVGCINAADPIALAFVLDDPHIPALPSHAWHELAEYARLILEQDTNESDRNDNAISLAFWHLGINKDLRPFVYFRRPGDGWIEFQSMQNGAGVPEAQTRIRELVGRDLIMRTRLEDQAKGIPRAWAVLMGKADWSSIDSTAVQDMPLTNRE